MSEVIIDVRERDEFDAEHIENSIHVPLSSFLSIAPGLLNQLKERNLVIMCRSGNRAKMAETQIAQLGYADKIRARVYEGGILEWKRQGKATVGSQKSHLPIMRQVQLVSGLSVFITTCLGAFVHPGFLIIAAFFGAGLSVAGATGYCGMAHLLAVMPWNRSRPTMRKELCQVSPSSGTCDK